MQHISTHTAASFGRATEAASVLTPSLHRLLPPASLCVAVFCCGVQRVAVGYSVLQYVAMSCGVLQCFVMCCSVRWMPWHRVLPPASPCVAVCCCGLQCVATCCNVLVSVLQCDAVCRCVLQCLAVCCIVLQCAAVCCSVLLQRDVDTHTSPCVAGRPLCCSVLQCVAVSCSVR